MPSFVAPPCVRPEFYRPVRHMCWGVQAIAEEMETFVDEVKEERAELIEVDAEQSATDESLLVRNCGLSEGTVEVLF